MVVLVVMKNGCLGFMYEIRNKVSVHFLSLCFTLSVRVMYAAKDNCKDICA